MDIEQVKKQIEPDIYGMDYDEVLDLYTSFDDHSYDNWEIGIDNAIVFFDNHPELWDISKLSNKQLYSECRRRGLYVFPQKNKL